MAADEEARVADRRDQGTEPDEPSRSRGGDDPSPADRLRELGGYIREQRNRAQLSLRNLAKLAGVSNPYLSQIERGLRKPSAEILQAIAKALRVSAETLYVKAGILEARPGDDDIESTIARDASLTEPQRQALIEMYRSFRRLHELEDGGAGTRTEVDRVLDRAADALEGAADRVAPDAPGDGDDTAADDTAVDVG